jgi:homoserine dehydrogenase
MHFHARFKKNNLLLFVFLTLSRSFTEATPHDDLSGLNFAHRVILMVRQLNISLSLEDITLKPFVPMEILKRSSSTNELIAALREYDTEVRMLERYILDSLMFVCSVF